MFRAIILMRSCCGHGHGWCRGWYATPTRSGYRPRRSPRRWRNCATMRAWWRMVSTSACGPWRHRRRARVPVRILFMGTATHDADFAIVEGALARLKLVFGEHVSVDLLGVSSRSDLPPWVNRIGMPVNATVSYPGFVNWITRQHWDIAIAPLTDTPFNRASRRSRLWTMRRWACRCWPRTARCTAARRPTAQAAGWCRMTRTPGLWRLPAWYATPGSGSRLSDGARTAFPAGTLAAQAAGRRAAWLGLVRTEQRSALEAAGRLAAVSRRRHCSARRDLCDLGKRVYTEDSGGKQRHGEPRSKDHNALRANAEPAFVALVALLSSGGLCQGKNEAMVDWTVVVPTLLAATVEWVEAFTIVLAVSLTIGWRAAVGAAATPWRSLPP